MSYQQRQYVAPPADALPKTLRPLIRELNELREAWKTVSDQEVAARIAAAGATRKYQQAVIDAARRGEDSSTVTDDGDELQAEAQRLALAETARAQGAQVTVLEETNVFGTALGLPGRWRLAHDLGEQGPDTIAFLRSADQFHNSQFTELPNAEYDFSLIRHFLYDTAETIRFEMLSHSSYMPLAQLAVKVRGELRYHTLHANTWINQLGNANEESIGKLQRALEHALPYALGLFEPSPFENELIGEGVFEGEKALEEKWKTKVAGLLAKTQLQLPQWEAIVPQLGGRSGKHTAHLQPLLDEMGEVFRIDPTAEW